MKKLLILIAAAVTLTTVLFALFNNDLRYTRADRILWNELKSTFEENKIARIELISDKKVELADEEKRDFISSLKKAQFYKSNWRKEGPTGLPIIIVFKDGSQKSFQYWGNAIFETSYKDGQFLIKSDEIKEVLEKFDIKLN